MSKNTFAIVCLYVAVFLCAIALNENNKTIEQKQVQLTALFERVQLLEDALSDKSGIKK